MVTFDIFGNAPLQVPCDYPGSRKIEMTEWARLFINIKSADDVPNVVFPAFGGYFFKANRKQRHLFVLFDSPGQSLR